jgi:NADPH:quinone reductase-like Zn-dependent oxidoreductase
MSWICGFNQRAQLYIVRRRTSVAELECLGADAVIVSTEGPIDEQVRAIVGPEGVKYAIDPVVGRCSRRSAKRVECWSMVPSPASRSGWELTHS